MRRVSTDAQKEAHFLGGNIEPTPVSQDEIEKAERAQAVQLEIEKVRTLPDDYWPAEWRKHVRALGITSLALIYWMADKAKGHEFDLLAAIRRAEWLLLCQRVSCHRGRSRQRPADPYPHWHGCRPHRPFCHERVTVDIEKDRTARESVDAYGSAVRHELETADDDLAADTGAREFFDWVRRGKALVRVFPKRPLHAKLYIFTLNDRQLDRGRVIKGSSNLTASGLDSNIEFNVEIKSEADYDYALGKFGELWDQSVDIPLEELGRIRLHTYLNDSISPYELYLKLLYEYFKGNLDVELSDTHGEYGANVKRLEYQIQAVRDAKFKVSQHKGVFLADVVGLGKTYMASSRISPLSPTPPSVSSIVRVCDSGAMAWSSSCLRRSS